MATLNGVPFSQRLVSSSKYGVKCPYSMKAKKVTVHNTDNSASAANEVTYHNSNNAEVSFHVAIDEKEAIQCVPFNRNAWASGDGGNGYGNRNTIHFEICKNYDRVRKTTNLGSAQQSEYIKGEANAVKVIAAVMHQQGIAATADNVKRHYDWSGKWCPSKILNESRWPIVQALIVNEAKRLYNGGTSTTTTTATTSNAVTNSKPVTSGKVGDKVKIVDSLYRDSVGSGRSTASRGKTGTIKKIATGAKKPYLIDNLGWAHANDIQLVSSATTTTTAKTTTTTSKVTQITVDGIWGAATTKRLQQVLGTTVDGIISGQDSRYIKNIPSAKVGSGGSAVIKAVQKKLKLTADGYLGPNTIKAMQKYYKTPVDGVISPKSNMVIAMQKALNSNKF